MPQSIQVPSDIVRKWQEIVDLLAAIVHVPSALIMRVESPYIKVVCIQRIRGESLRTGRTRTSQHGSLLRDRDENPSAAACP
jgi:hypothetical protein